MSMTTSEPTFNLTAFSDRLFDENRLLPLANAIRRARDLHSLITDLTHALESLDALDRLGEVQTDDLIGIVTQSALMNNAVVLYARATKTTSQERRGFDLFSRFTDDETVVHEELCDLRDKAIAHFGSGGTYRGEWQAELVILQIQGQDGRPGVLSRRKTLDKKLIARARKQIEVALAHLQVLIDDKLSEVSEELKLAMSNDPEFYKEFERHRLNLDIFLASPGAAEAARASFDKGHAKGAVKHD